APDAFAETVAAAADRGLAGLNVTLPFKEQALAHADEASEAATAAGAANVLLFQNGRTRADNTDGEGLLYALQSQAPGVDFKSRPVAILGAGGAAKGAAAALAAMGAREIRIVNRTRPRADQLAVELMLDFDIDAGACDFSEAISGAGLL